MTTKTFEQLKDEIAILNNLLQTKRKLSSQESMQLVQLRFMMTTPETVKLLHENLERLEFETQKKSNS